MGNMLINVLAFAIMQGLNGALETLISRQYGQSKDPMKSEAYKVQARKECGILHNRGRFVVACVMVPIVVIFSFADTILIAIHQDPGVSKIA